jgi:hypothetical protein
MSEFIQGHTSEWVNYFRAAGYPTVRPLASGVEGAIYKLSDGLAAKVWGRRRVAELERMQTFYADTAKAGLPFATPEILKIESVNGVAVTYERELHGEPLQKYLGAEGPDVEPGAAAVLSHVLAALAAVPGTSSMKNVPVLDEEHSMWTGKATFPEAMIGLLDRRMSRFAIVLAPKVKGFDRKYQRVVAGLGQLGDPPVSVVHGDLFGENILVDSARHVTAVLDFGFLATAGDPRLDAAISAVIFNMYGPHALTISTSLTNWFAEELGYPVETLRLYQAAYALATSNIFTPDGAEGDGHFEWCVAMLNNDDIMEA